MNQRKSTMFWCGILLALLVLSAVAAYAVSQVKVRDATANIYVDGKLVRSIALDRVTEAYTFEVSEENGWESTIEVAHGRIRVAKANCPDHICEKQGWISDGIQPIVCLPHRLVIEIVQAGDTIDTAT